MQLFLTASGNSAGSINYFAGDKALRPERRFMIEKNTGAGKKIISVTVVGNFPEGSGLGNGVRTAGTKRSIFVSRFTAGITETFAGTGIVQPDRNPQETNRFQQVECADADTFQCFYRLIEG